MARALQILRVIAGVVLVLVGTGLLSSSSSLLTRLDLLHVAPPICLPLDLSAQGAYSGRYSRLFSAVADDQLRLVLAGSPSEEETKRLLHGLRAVMTLQDGSGRVLSEQIIGADDFHRWANYRRTGLVVALSLDEVRHQAGDYDLSIEVKTPAKAMEGHPHCIVAELGLCNAEAFGVYAVGLPVGWITLLLGIILLILGRRRQPKPVETPACGSVSSP